MAQKASICPYVPKMSRFSLTPYGTGQFELFLLLGRIVPHMDFTGGQLVVTMGLNFQS